MTVNSMLMCKKMQRLKAVRGVHCSSHAVFQGKTWNFARQIDFNTVVNSECPLPSDFSPGLTHEREVADSDTPRW
jgi:hypothetical protein